MTVKELIELLQEEDPDQQVWIGQSDYQGDAAPARTVGVANWGSDAFNHVLIDS